MALSGHLETDASREILHTYDATNLANELYTITQNSRRGNPGAPVKFGVPIVAHGKVYAGAQCQLSVYGPWH